jgi:3-oxoacyl-[acyl-carrier-protein] synthase III
VSTGVAIVGAAEADEIGVVPHKSSVQMHAEAATNALASANLTLGDVDALYTCGLDFMPSLLVSEYLGLRPRVSSSDSIGGSSFVAHVHEAVQAIRAGRCEVALITHGETRRSNRRRGVQTRPAHFDPWLPDWQWSDRTAWTPRHRRTRSRPPGTCTSTAPRRGTSPSSRSPRAPGPC